MTKRTSEIRKKNKDDFNNFIMRNVHNAFQKFLIFVLVTLLLLIVGVFIYSSFIKKEVPLPSTSLAEGAVTTEYFKANAQTGDVVGISFMNKFHPRIQVIRLATGSRWMHVGLVYRNSQTKQLYIAEAFNYLAPKKLKCARSQKGVQLVPIDEWFAIHVRKAGSGRLVGWNALKKNDMPINYESLDKLLEATDLKTTVNLDILSWVSSKRKRTKTLSSRKQIQSASDQSVNSPQVPVLKDKKKYFCTEFVCECLYRLGVSDSTAFIPTQSATSSIHDAYSPFEVLKGLPLKSQFQWSDIKCVLPAS